MNLEYYLTREWVLGDYECWAFVCEVYRRELGVELPIVNVGCTFPRAVRKALAMASERDLFTPIEKPEHFAVVEMGREWPSHVGVYLETADGPRILHCRQGTFGLCDPLSVVEREVNIFGYYRLKPKCQ